MAHGSRLYELTFPHQPKSSISLEGSTWPPKSLFMRWQLRRKYDRYQRHTPLSIHWLRSRSWNHHRYERHPGCPISAPAIILFFIPAFNPAFTSRYPVIAPCIMNTLRYLHGDSYETTSQSLTVFPYRPTLLPLSHYITTSLIIRICPTCVIVLPGHPLLPQVHTCHSKKCTERTNLLPP